MGCVQGCSPRLVRKSVVNSWRARHQNLHVVPPTNQHCWASGSDGVLREYANSGMAKKPISYFRIKVSVSFYKFGVIYDILVSENIFEKNVT